jgi:hypothetical protein
MRGDAAAGGFDFGAGAYAINKSLLNLSFFIDNMLSGDRIVLLHFQLVRHGPLIFISGIKMTRTGR